jgi:phosphomannomutase
VNEEIRFGTDGWRGVIARDFTFANVARVGAAIAAYLQDPKRREGRVYREWGVPFREAEAGVLVGYDTRFFPGISPWSWPRPSKQMVFPLG